MPVQRSPNLPAVRTRTRSPGDVRLEDGGLIAPEPLLERMMTSFLVPTNSLSCEEDAGVHRAELGGCGGGYRPQPWRTGRREGAGRTRGERRVLRIIGLL